MRKENHIHIIAFDVPYPPDYGGVIDIYYKLKSLWKAGIKIHLHCFVYGKRKPRAELNLYCAEVNYYRRKTGPLSFLSMVPYIIKSRMSRELEDRLLDDDYPILCEGIHTCGLLLNPAYRDRKILFRPSNVEHEYYAGLARLERNLFKKIFFLTEARKLQRWEKNLGSVAVFFPVSEHDEAVFKTHFPGKRITLLYSFHPFDEVDIRPGKGEYVLFHGNLSVRDNERVALYLLEEIAPEIDMPLVIAGKDPSGLLKERIRASRNVRLEENPDEKKMVRLIREAHIHLLLTYQKAGLKLKLVLALFRGRHLIVNREMLTLEGLEKCVVVAGNTEALIKNIQKLKGKVFSREQIGERKGCLPLLLRNEEKVRVLIRYL